MASAGIKPSLEYLEQITGAKWASREEGGYFADVKEKSTAAFKTAVTLTQVLDLRYLADVVPEPIKGRVIIRVRPETLIAKVKVAKETEYSVGPFSEKELDQVKGLIDAEFSNSSSKIWGIIGRHYAALACDIVAISFFKGQYLIYTLAPLNNRLAQVPVSVESMQALVALAKSKSSQK